jgi:uncharacterized protein YjbI with pentapeptide repeats
MEMVLFVGSIVGILIALTILLFIILRYRHLAERLTLQQTAWERAQEAHQQQWHIQQERVINELDKQLTTQVQQVQQQWRVWTEQETAHIAQLRQHYDALTRQTSIEYELAHIPHTSDAALPTANTTVSDQRYAHAARLNDADLSSRDLSRRSLANADLRGACLVKANLFMADLSGASLVNANLSGADLSGANLCGADLRHAILTDANLLVTDLNAAILLDTNLRGAHCLTVEQLRSAIVDATTQHDLDETQAHTSSVKGPAEQNQTCVPASLDALPNTPYPHGLSSPDPDMSTVCTPVEEPLNEYDNDEEITQFDTLVRLPVPFTLESRASFDRENTIYPDQRETGTKELNERDNTITFSHYNEKRHVKAS